MPTYFTTAQVVAAADALDPFTPWLRDMFFTSVALFETQEIIFDRIGRRRKIAPFVSPNVPGKERERRARQATAYSAPYLKPKNSLRPNDSQVRLTGERYGGEMSMLDRHEVQVQQTLADHENEIRGREEKMCADLLINGQVVAEGEGISDTIDYSRDASLSTALTTTARWGETGVLPLDNLRAWARSVGSISGGVVRNWVMGYGAAEIFTKDDDVREILDNRRQRDGEMSLAAGATGGLDDVARYIGSIEGLNFWEYTQTYEDDADQTQHFWPQYGVAGIGARMDGHMAYGAIQDFKSMRAEARFSKIFEEDDPSTEVLLTQSAPLPVPVDINQTFYASVR